MASLKMIVGWLVEYSLRYDLRQLRQQLKILFPELIKSVDFADEMTENTLYRIETLRVISSKESQDEILNNLDNLETTILSFETISEDTTQFTQCHDRENQRKDFLNKLRMIKELLSIRATMLKHLLDFKENVSQISKMSNDIFSVSLTFGVHDGKERVLKNDGKNVIDRTKVDSEVMDIKKYLTAHVFIKTFDNFAKEIVFNGKLTALEKFVKYRNLCVPFKIKVKLFNLNLEDAVDDKNEVEYKLISVAQDLAKQEIESKKPKQPKIDLKEPKWCPIIYVDDPMSPGHVIAINIKNAYENSEDSEIMEQ